MNKAKDRSAFWFICLCILLTVFALSDASASGDCRDGSCNEVILSGGDNTANNSVLIDGSRAYAFSHSLGDVDINDCLASTQWGTILVSRQRVVLNKWCAAEVYDYKGLHHMAALLRCDIKEIGDFFESQEECLKENTVSFNEPLEGVSRGTPEEVDLTPILSRLNELESRNSELQAEYDALEQRRQRAARLAQEEDDRARKRAQDALSALEAYE